MSEGGIKNSVGDGVETMEDVLTVLNSGYPVAEAFKGPVGPRCL